MEEENKICLHCGNPLTGKQQKYCSKLCSKRNRHKIYMKKKWRLIYAKAKTRKIEKKLRRKFKIEQEIKRREELAKNAGLSKREER